MANFQNYSKYYDLLYKDKNYKEEVDYIIQVLKEFDSSAKNILELGSGSGSHAYFLSQNGFNITGIERSQSMVQESLQKKILNFKPIQADITDFEVNQEFDAVISLFHVISYLTHNDSLINCLRLVHKHLKPHGIFLFDFWYTPAVYSLKPETRIKRLEDESISVVRIAESTVHTLTNIVDVNFEVHIQDKKTSQTEVLKELHPMRHFSIPELDLLAKIAGFEILKSEEFLTKNEPSENTWGVCLILRKK
ncbi:class I SAM-dependent methyltransferase [Flavobacterium sp. LHD-80]|uniref:class I SAM-dependent DNA methyltransferase n=1 Tax=Flavobacterium sp. LHD-80 TaxID=3071411 RepID=UPI0027DF71E8|nr:class I SAM-dependent methyltransferase [Flavobacterium sp. LHD-80]MDQ6472075.1 class I SAM-dependent methyltransferase [Flavobacterium sp. LHD-80]